MQWVEISIITTEDASDAICEMLAQIGADGIAVTNPFEIARIINDPNSLAYADEGYIDSLGTDITVKAYFAEFDDGIRLGPKSDEYVDPNGVGMIYGNITDKRMSVEEALEYVKTRLADIGQFLDVGKGLDSWKYVKDQDWENEWKKDYTSFRISDRIIICPSWEEYDNVNNDIIINLDPGSAFGTGTHETTSMCSEILDRLMTPDTKILDVGTGSGILSIICEKLGAKELEAIDIDPLAIDVAIENCKINDATRIVCHTGELNDCYSNDYTIIVANIIADTIAAITPDVPSKLAPGGIYLCSGIINTKKEKVENELKKAGFKILEHHERNDWQAYVCTLA